MSRWTDFNSWIERNETFFGVLAIAAAILAILLFTGCVNTETRSEGHRVLERTETPTANGGKITIEKEHTEEGSETVTKADLSATVQSAVAALRGDLPGLLAAVVPKPTESKLLGFTMPEIAATAGALWTAERGMAVYHKRRRIKLESKP